ncbi:MAG: putative metal-binding motif-containing protein [Deltaproteobacteria bacterium]|nr:putative metal-binding motif-containing protein [Deltaproteobacteria bacterium]
MYPGATEVSNGVDDDCDGLIDDNTDAFDDDGDGFTEEDGDCDDTNAGIHPAAAELLDAVDNDCDGVVDETTVGYDDDGDGFTELEGDCDDGDTDTYPGASELPDSEDNDCNGQIDDGSFITDDDGDGFTDLAGDCDDTNPYTNPAAPEYLDGFDNDCDGVIDEDLNTSDDDGDGFSEAQGDCNDSNAAIYPGALELDDGIDNDCDGLGYTSPPIAVATVVGQQQSCSPVQLSAANSYDPDGDTLDFTWFFTTVPPLSDLTDDDILDRFGMEPSFVPDAAGYWAVALQVTDGYFQSSPATVGFTVSARPGNNAPVAAFTTGNSNLFDSTTCSTDAYGACTTCPACEVNELVDATASSDADGDPLWYTWDAVKVSGDGSAPELTVTSVGTATTAISVGTTCGTTAAGLFEISVEVKDCNGATDDTSLQVNLSCQGL